MSRFHAAFDTVRARLHQVESIAQFASQPALRERAERLTRELEDREARVEVQLTGASGAADIEAELLVRGELTTRQRRLLTSLWPRIDPMLVVRYLGEHPALFPRLRRSILTRYDEWLALPPSSRQVYLEGLRWYEDRAGAVLGARRFAEWVRASGPAMVAESLGSEAMASDLRPLGLGESWQYSAYVRASILERALATAAVDAVIEQIRSLPLRARYRFVPPREGMPEADALFRQQASHGDMLLSWLRAAMRDARGASRVDQILIDALGDPLGPLAQRRTQTWSELERRDEEAYRSLLQRLTRTDIRFFFENQRAEDARARAEFWLRYLPVIRRAKSFLSATDRSEFEALARSASDPSYPQALQRAGRFRSSGAQAPSAFVLWFDSVVVVEFSRTGNATYLYARAEFDRLGIHVDSAILDRESDLKDKSLGEAMRHAKGWQLMFAERLGKLGVDPARTSTLRRGPGDVSSRSR